MTAQPTVARATLAANAQKIDDVRIYPPFGVSITSMPPPLVHVLWKRVNGEIVLSIRFTTSGEQGDPALDAWITFSDTLLTNDELVNWGTDTQPVYQMVPFDTVVAFPAGRETVVPLAGSEFRRSDGSGEILFEGTVSLAQPMYMQLIVRMPGANPTGFVPSFAHGLHTIDV